MTLGSFSWRAWTWPSQLIRVLLQLTSRLCRRLLSRKFKIQMRAILFSLINCDSFCSGERDGKTLDTSTLSHKNWSWNLVCVYLSWCAHDTFSEKRKKFFLLKRGFIDACRKRKQKRFLLLWMINTKYA